MASSLLIQSVQSEELTAAAQAPATSPQRAQPPALSIEELEALERSLDEPIAPEQPEPQDLLATPAMTFTADEIEAKVEHKVEAAEQAKPQAPPLKAPVIERDEPLSGPFEVLDELLRSRSKLLRRIERGQDLRQIARAMLLVIGCSAAALGAVLGMYRGGEQVLYAAIKLPLVLIGAATVCAPVYTALKRSLGDEAVFAKDLALFLSALALASLMSASLSPLLLCAILDGAGYHALILATVVLVGLGGLAGYEFFFRGMSMQIKRGHRVISTTLLIVMGLVGSQLSWLMRPYLVRPQTEAVPFVRALEGSFFDAVVTSISSSQGRYKRHAPYDVTRTRASHMRGVKR